MDSRRRLRAWFRDDDGDWQLPEGRRGEFVALLVGLPVLALVASSDPGLPRPIEHWPLIVVGACCGFLYATAYRTPIVERVPEEGAVRHLFFFLAGGSGLSILEAIRIAAPTAAFVLAAGGTILLIYAVRLCSPFHSGLEPPPRGADPPPAANARLDPGTDASENR